MTDSIQDIFGKLELLAMAHPDTWRVSACGVTSSLRSIPALLDRDAHAPTTNRARVLLVAGLSGQPEDTAKCLELLNGFATGGDSKLQHIALSSIPCGSPDRLMADSSTSGHGDASTNYPPQGIFYQDADNPERQYLWRWIGFQAPDLLVEICLGDEIKWEANGAAERLAPPLSASNCGSSDSLVAAIGTGLPNDLGPIPGLRLTAPGDAVDTEMDRLWKIITQTWVWSPSPARNTLNARRVRTPTEVAHVLASAYGHTLDPVVYTQGVAISGRLRLAALDSERPSPTEDITALVEDHVTRGLDQVLDVTAGSSSLAGLVWGNELTRATGDQRYSDLLLNAANRFKQAGPGKPPSPSSPEYRVEDMFANSAMLGRAYRITGENRYLDLLTPILTHCDTQQEDGLFWHCRGAEYLWSRGNGFAAMGFAEALTYLPQEHPARPTILKMHLKHLDALRAKQQPSGMYLEVLDFPGSYQEFTSTCQIGYAVARGLRRGWLDPSYRGILDLAWQGVVERIDHEGNVVDACISTGVQKSVQDYLHRQAIFGRDDRSGSMGLWFSVELARLNRGI